MNKLIIWDFDGTLGYREGNWEEVIFELSADKIKRTKENFDLISGMLQTGFPWHEPAKTFASITKSRDWWAYVQPRFIEIFNALNYDRHQAMLKAAQVPAQYGKLENWKLYSDTIPCLLQLHQSNWKSVLVTNNIPEFPAILRHLSLETYFDAVFVSSLVGFNKPNPLILNGYLETLQEDVKIVVVGDREESDLALANVLGAEGILVRTASTNQAVNFDNLNELTNYLLSLNFK